MRAAQRQTSRSIASRQRQRARVPGRARASSRPLAASQGWVERLCETKRIARGRRVSLPLEPSCESTCSDALSRAALAPQLTDRPVCEPPQIPLAVLSQSREAPGQPGAQLIAIVVRKLGIGSDELP